MPMKACRNIYNSQSPADTFEGGRREGVFDVVLYGLGAEVTRQRRVVVRQTAFCGSGAFEERSGGTSI